MAQPDLVSDRVPSQRAPIPAALLTTLSVCILVGAFAVAYLLHTSYKARLQQTSDLLTTIGDEKLRVIDLWVRERKSDADTMSQFPVIQELVTRPKSVPMSHVRAVLDAFENNYDYLALYVLDKNGNLLASTSHAPAFPTDRLRISAPPTLPYIESLIPDDQSAPGPPPIAVMSPIWHAGDTSEPVGTLVCISKPSALAAVVETPPAARGVRTLFLSRTRGGRIVYISPLRSWPPKVRGWVDSAALPAVNGENKFLDRSASDGSPEYCVTRAVPVLGWGMVTRIERSAVDRPFLLNVALTTGLFLVVVAMIISIVVAFWRRQQVQLLQVEIERRLETEEMLRQSEERWKKAFRSSPEAIAISSLKDGHYIEMNDNFLKVFGFRSREEVVGKPYRELNLWVHPEERERVVEEVRNHGHIAGEVFRIRDHAGRILDMEVSAESLHLQGEDCLMILGRDVTAQRQLEEQYRQSQKMEAVGRLAGGIAHDFNNMLAVISLSCELMLEEEGPDSTVGRRLAVVRNATERAAGLTRQLLAFSRQQVLQPQVTDVNAIVVDTKKMLERVIGEDIEIYLDLWKQPCPIMADAGQVVQILMNLAVNSRDAMPEGGKLTLRTRISMLPNTVIHEGYEDKPHVVLSVSDTGIGIALEVQQRIFEPFFTTKRDGKGTGLGLATVYGIVKQSNGCIQLTSEVGCGTTFHIYFPVAKIEAPAPLQEPEAEQHSGHGLILLVEDEFEIRELARQTLTSCGYKVETAVDGIDALKKFEAGEAYDLLITDLTMPRMSGQVLVTLLRERSVCPRVLYISAYSDAVLSSEDGSVPDFLPKPFSRHDLLAKVRAVLRGLKRGEASTSGGTP